MAKQQITSAHITRDDLERNFRSLQQGVQGTSTTRSPPSWRSLGHRIILAFLLFLLGRRSGKKKTTLVEIRRF